jgi:hypothetical protein
MAAVSRAAVSVICGASSIRSLLPYEREKIEEDKRGL